MEDLRINLYDLWHKNINELPKFVHLSNCIYRLHNLVNNKNYIGQTKMTLLNGWTTGSMMSHHDRFLDSDNDHKYNAIRKYGEDKFEVELLEYNLNVSNLNNHEKYWIEYFNSFGPNGYNKNSGGNNCEQFQLAGRAKSLELWPDTNGASPEFIDAGHKKMKELYPETNGACPQWFEAGLAAELKMYPDTNGASPEFISKGSLTRLFNAILKRLAKLESDGYELNAVNYVTKSVQHKCTYREHIPSVLRRIDDLRKLEGWTDVMESIFSKLRYNKDATYYKDFISIVD